jgi:dihydropteroate synthase
MVQRVVRQRSKCDHAASPCKHSLERTQQTTYTYTMILTLRHTDFDLASRCHYMGIVNVTPDSFSDGGRFDSTEAVVSHALRLIEDGADMIDIGGESTRPGATPISVGDEIRRVAPVIEALRRETEIPISIDTRNADVAEVALEAGADLINDISALRHDPRMSAIAVRHDAPVVLMHMLGTPETMQSEPRYRDVVSEVLAFFEERIAAASSAGVRRIILDPGIGFGKRLEDNLALLRNLETFQRFHRPLLVGPSRKTFIGLLTGALVHDRLAGTLGSCVMAVRFGASMLRVHDVKEVRMAVQVAEAIASAPTEALR